MVSKGGDIMDLYLKNELSNYANAFINNAFVDIKKSGVDERTKKLAENLCNDVQEVLVAFVNKIAETK